MERFLIPENLFSYLCCFGETELDPELFVSKDKESVPRLPNGQVHGKVEEMDQRSYVRKKWYIFGVLKRYSCEKNGVIFLEGPIEDGLPQGIFHYTDFVHWDASITFKKGRLLDALFTPKYGDKSLYSHISFEWDDDKKTLLVIEEHKRVSEKVLWKYFDISFSSSPKGCGYQPSSCFHSLDDVWLGEPLYLFSERAEVQRNNGKNIKIPNATLSFPYLARKL